MQATAPFKEASDLIRDAGGESFKRCFQCGMCTASCPWNAVRSYTPHRLITELRWECQICRPVDFASDGIFVCGMAHGPKLMEESVSQARAAAARAMTVLSREAWTAQET